MEILNFVFKLAMLAFGAHMISSFMLSTVTRKKAVANEIFAIKNTPQTINYYPLRLLLIKYYFPWVRSPELMHKESIGVRSIFFISRYSGLVFLCLVASILLLVIAQGISNA